MAFTFGFFNSKNLDRTYTAENFCDYLGSIICNGIQDTYGKCFSLTAASSGLKVTLGSGKAWIDGHYFINDSNYSIDLSGFQDESLPRYVAIVITLDTSESVRSVKLDMIPGTPAENPKLPEIPRDEYRTSLLLYGVRLNVGATKLTSADWYDYRDDNNACGYCRCILGKCKITEILSQLATLIGKMDEYNGTIQKLTNKVNEMENTVQDIVGGVVESGKIGDSVYYVLYSNGKVLITGSGEIYDYELTGNRSPLCKRNDIKKAVFSDGITHIGDYLMEDCEEMLEVSLPETVEVIGYASFMMSDPHMGITHGPSMLNVPTHVTEIRRNAFWGTAITSLVIPASVTTVDSYVCRDCYELKTVRYEGEMIGDYMFVSCEALTDFTIGNTVKQLGQHIFNYCKSLEQIIFEGSLEDWSIIKKGYNWDGRSGNSAAQSGLSKILCIDGYMEYDAETKTWKEVKE